MTKAIVERTDKEKLQLAHETVDYLNELLVLSYDAIAKLVEVHTQCDIALSEHPTVQVVAVQDSQPAYVVGMLGIINGLVGAREGIGYIVANFSDETGKLLCFSVATDEQHKQLKGAPFPRTNKE